MNEIQIFYFILVTSPENTYIYQIYPILVLKAEYMNLISPVDSQQKHVLIYIKLLLTAIFWGGTFIAGRVIAQSVDPYSAAFIRFFIAATILLLMVYKIEKGFPCLDFYQTVQIILLGLTGV